MSTFIDSIFDKLGNVILPKTVTKAVWGQTTGNRLDQELSGIEAALASPNTGTTADTAYAKGKYIYHVLNKELYKAKSAIAQGASFNKASGGNVEVVNIGDELLTLNSDIATMQAHTISSQTAVDISSYTSSAYTAPSDGYITAISATTGSTGYVKMSDVTLLSVPINQLTDTKSVFVRKGSQITVSGSFYIVIFRPLF